MILKPRAPSVPAIEAAEPDCRSSSTPFVKQLEETILWCATRTSITNVRDCLRSEDLRPRVLEASYARSVWSVAITRQPRVAGIQRDPAVISQARRRGRLLVYFPESDLADGAAEVQSEGFFDVHNTPPWDTWVAFIEDAGQDDINLRGYLVSWVPAEFVDHVQRGIDVNPEECIQWLDRTGVALVRRYPDLATDSH